MRLVVHGAEMYFQHQCFYKCKMRGTRFFEYKTTPDCFRFFFKTEGEYRKQNESGHYSVGSTYYVTAAKPLEICIEHNLWRPRFHDNAYWAIVEHAKRRIDYAISSAG